MLTCSRSFVKDLKWNASIHKCEAGRGALLPWIRQRIESTFWTLKDRLGLERQRARTLRAVPARIAFKLLALAT